MTAEKIAAHIDHTLLKAFCSWEQIQELCDEAVTYKTASVCVPSCFIKRIRETYGPDFTICTVVGFPLGYGNTESKLAETKQALLDGADEIDMVINITDVKDGKYQKVEDEIALLKEKYKY